MKTKTLLLTFLLLNSCFSWDGPNIFDPREEEERKEEEQEKTEYHQD